MVDRDKLILDLEVLQVRTDSVRLKLELGRKRVDPEGLRLNLDESFK